MKKVAIITGGSSGIGKELVRVYSGEGYHVLFTGRNEDRLQATQKEFSTDEVECIGLKLDASLEKDNKELIDQALEKFGRIDVLICNAGVSMRALFQDLELDVFKKVMDINFYGPIYAVKYALPHLLASKGNIVAISSINGHRSTPARSAYSASKFAMEGFFESLRTELLKSNVHVLVVNPGFTGTKIRVNALDANGHTQGESPRDERNMMSPGEVAERTFRAMKRKKRKLLLTRTGRWLVRLNYYFPGIIDRIVYNVLAREPDSPFK